MKQSRLFYLDALRGIAAVIVVLVHYFAAFYPYSVFGSAGGQQHQTWEKLFFFPPFGLLLNGHLAVCLFFILSGFLLSYRYIGASGKHTDILVAMVKRPIRLAGLALFSILLSASLWRNGLYFNHTLVGVNISSDWFNQFWQGEFSLLKLLHTATISLFRNGYLYNPPLWTIRIELYGSFMSLLFLLFFKNSKYLVALLFTLVVVFHNSLYQGFWLGMLIATGLKHGVLDAWPQTQKTWVNHWAMGSLTALLVYLSSYPHYAKFGFLSRTIYAYLPDDNGFGGGYPMLTALLLFLLLCLNRQVQNLLNQKYLLFIGRISYGVYIIHFLILGSLSSWFFLQLNQYYTHEFSFLITLILGFSLSILSAYFATTYIDIPCIKLANYVGQRARLQIESMCIALPKVWGRRITEKPIQTDT
ncbi:acyltransferase [filamentous cyanobacterium LEGE 11480]|uniref:Acyltransferase n=1 Tax=Romeriopsis navalis LEGE 11480 TaxID=2777977 RepID=A0A928VVW3_9CYAN|nr:acyltransferase [Romeriopsis navalis]MBE9033164.1 acyltransferase [Romeriopsis navalis LEGE 11480]